MCTSFVRTILIIAMVSAAGMTLGQSFGIHTGLQKASIRTAEAKDAFGTEIGYTVGLFLNVGLVPNFGILAEAMYGQKIITQQEAVSEPGDTSDPDVKLHLGSVEIPVALVWRPEVQQRVRPRVYAGPVMSVIVDEKVNLTDRPFGEVLDEAYVLTREAFADRDLGWLVGVGISFDLVDVRITTLQLMADVRYVGGLTSVQKEFAGNPLRRRIGVGAFNAMIGLGF